MILNGYKTFIRDISYHHLLASMDFSQASAEF